MKALIRIVIELIRYESNTEIEIHNSDVTKEQLETMGV